MTLTMTREHDGVASVPHEGMFHPPCLSWGKAMAAQKVGAFLDLKAGKHRSAKTIRFQALFFSFLFPAGDQAVTQLC